eukprot:GHVR01051767.1.p2 GENE.GHVR01051767.1~~GHVR01051767.1.p2  ORF type:complete len:288 (+),score=143.43 GHVR01051767.1:1026-1889(+)
MNSLTILIHTHTHTHTHTYTHTHETSEEEHELCRRAFIRVTICAVVRLLASYRHFMYFLRQVPPTKHTHTHTHTHTETPMQCSDLVCVFREKEFLQQTDKILGDPNAINFLTEMFRTQAWEVFLSSHCPTYDGVPPTPTGTHSEGDSLPPVRPSSPGASLFWDICVDLDGRKDIRFNKDATIEIFSASTVRSTVSRVLARVCVTRTIITPEPFWDSSIDATEDANEYCNQNCEHMPTPFTNEHKQLIKNEKKKILICSMSTNLWRAMNTHTHTHTHTHTYKHTHPKK